MENDNKVVENITNGNDVTVNTPKEVEKEIVKEEKMFNRDDFNRAIAAEKSKLRAELEKEAEAKRTEAEKLARMDEKEKSDYELKKANERAILAETKLNAHSLKETAFKIATEKDVPISYLELIDFTKETAETINEKISNIANARTKDLEKYLSSHLKETSPKQVSGGTAKADPFLKGFEDAWKK